MLPNRCRALGDHGGPDVGRRSSGKDGRVDGLRPIEEVSEVRAGRRFAFVMDTRLCEASTPSPRGATCS